MTTSYVLERQRELKALKMVERQLEKTAMEKAMDDAIAKKQASDYRIAAKMARIEGRAAPAAPEPTITKTPEVVAAVEEPQVAPVAAKAAPKKKAALKKTPKKRK